MRTVKWLLLSCLICGLGVVFAEYGDSCYKDCQCDKEEWCDMTGNEKWSGWGSCVHGDNPDKDYITSSEPGTCKLKHEPGLQL